MELKKIGSVVVLLLSIAACADKGEDTTGTGDGGTATDSGADGGNADSGTTDGGSSDGGTTDSGSSDGGSSDGGSSDGGSSDGGSSDGGSSDGGSSDGGSGDGGGGGDTGDPGFSLPEKWGSLIDGPSCNNGAFASLRNATDTLGMEIDVSDELVKACASKDYKSTTTVPAKAFKLLQGTGINFEVCPQPSSSKSKATIENEFLMSAGTVTLEVAASPKWCADSSITLMGQARTVFADVIAGTGDDARAMGPTDFEPVYLNQAPPE